MAEGADAASTAAAKATIAVKFTSSDKAAGQVSISLEGTVGELKEAIRYRLSISAHMIDREPGIQYCCNVQQ